MLIRPAPLRCIRSCILKEASYIPTIYEKKLVTSAELALSFSFLYSFS